MLDLRAIREDPEPYRKALARRGVAGELDRVLAVDQKRRELVARVEQLRAEQNRGSKAIGSAKDPGQREGIIEQVRLVSDEPLSPAQETTLRAIIQGALGHPFAVDFTYFADQIPRGPGEKFEEFVCKVVIPPDAR